jgi:transposase-like zinc ribbon protein
MDARLIQVRDAFETDEQCWTYLESARWPEGVRCPKCGGAKVSRFVSGDAKRERFSKKQGKLVEVRVPARRLYQCNTAGCLYQFSAITATALAGSHLPIRTWFLAIGIMASSKMQVSAKQLERELSVSYRTAWYLTHRLREAFASPGSSAGAGGDRSCRESSR